MEQLTATPVSDNDTFAAFYDRYCNLAYSLAMRITGDPATAQAAVVAAFDAARSEAVAFNPEEAIPLSWLLNLVRGASIEQLMRRRGRPREETPVSAAFAPAMVDRSGDLPEMRAELPYAELRTAVRDALQALSGAERSTLELTFFQGYSCEEIARLRGTAADEVVTQLQQALDKLIGYVEPLPWTQ